MSLDSDLSKYANFVAPNTSTESHHEKFMVSPYLPTVAGDCNRYPLLGSDLSTLLVIQSLHVVPELIETPKFTDALAATLSAFPTFAGRIRHGEASSDWSIELTNSPVPITVDRNSKTPLPDEWVVVSSNFGDFIEPISFLELVNKDKPLLSIKLSLFPEKNTSVVGIIVAHQVADAFHLWEFSKVLSDYYLGIMSESLPPFVIPKPFPIPELSQEQMAEMVGLATDPRFQDVTVPREKAYAELAKDDAQSAPIRFRISPTQLEALRAAVKGDSSEDAPLSRLDTLAGYLISTINHFITESINHAYVVWNYRPFTEPAHYGGNAASSSFTQVLSEDERRNPSAIAIALRQSLQRARDPDVFRLIGLTHGGLFAAESQGLIINQATAQGRLILNSNAKYDWNAVHFGHPGRVRFHTCWFGDRYLRVFPSNPLIVDGEVVDSRSGSWDVFFRVEKVAAPAILEVISRDLEMLKRGTLHK